MSLLNEQEDPNNIENQEYLDIPEEYSEEAEEDEEQDIKVLLSGQSSSSYWLNMGAIGLVCIAAGWFTYTSFFAEGVSVSPNRAQVGSEITGGTELTQDEIGDINYNQPTSPPRYLENNQPSRGKNFDNINNNFDIPDLPDLALPELPPENKNIFQSPDLGATRNQRGGSYSGNSGSLSREELYVLQESEDKKEEAETQDLLSQVSENYDYLDVTSKNSLVTGGRSGSSSMKTKHNLEELRSLKKANSLVVSGGSSSWLEDAEEEVGDNLMGNIPSLESAKYEEDFEIVATESDSIQVTRAGNMSFTITQGKLIEAILDTEINTELEGPVRGMVTRDVYSSNGRYLLFPRGTRVIGGYDVGDIQRGRARLYITWGRLIRPDGIDIALDSPATDNLGRAGILGDIDNKYLEIVGGQALVSVISAAAGIWADNYMRNSTADLRVGDIASLDTVNDEILRVLGGSTATQLNNRNIAAEALNTAINQFNDTMTQLTEETINESPVINIPIGTRLRIFVNQDIQFPKSLIIPSKRLDLR